MKNQKIKREKGITVIALIITIIVLLILAVVAINAVQGDGIISKAKNARDSYVAAQDKENTTLGDYLTILNNLNGEGEAEGSSYGELKAYTDASRDLNGYLTENAKYTDGENAVATIPAGFKVSEVTEEQTIKTGLVIKDSESNEFVWIPVENTIWDGTTTIQGNYTPMVKSQSSNTSNYEGILYDINNLGWTGREVDTLSRCDGITTYLEKAGITESENQNETYFKNQLQTEFNNMVASVSKYKGFYVARYELSTTNEGKLASKAGATVTTAETNDNMWYGLYNISKTYNVTNSVTSNMIYGCQYDAMLRWMQNANIDVTSKRIISGVSYNTNPTLTGWYNSDDDKDTDKLNNVYDLIGGHLEWTQEAFKNDQRVYRSGFIYCSLVGYRTAYPPNKTYSDFSSRSALYIK